MAQKAAVVLAAGKGTRMKTELPKVAVPLLGRAMLLHVLDHLVETGFTRIVLIIGYGREVIRDMVKDRKDAQIEFAIQEEQKGTAHALMCAKPVLDAFNGTVLVTCGDMPMIRTSTFRTLMEQHAKDGNAATVLSAVLENPTGYGRLVRSPDGSLLRIVEEKDADDETRKLRETNSGTYCFESPDIFRVLSQIDTNNKQGEYYLPDAAAILVKENKRVGVAFTQDADEALGANSPEDLQVLEAKLSRRLAQAI